MSKKFVNRIEETVDDALYGLVLSNSSLKFHESCERVVLRSDLDTSKVSLIAGGGSGHEPYAAGYIGKGLLTAAVAGNVFASPPSRNVQAALEGTKGNAGAILFVINYTGDRLNFGLAAERFNASGGNAKVVTIADDVAIDSPSNRVGKRGLAGAVLTIKIAGAMSEQGKPLDEIHAMSQKVVGSLGTLGVSLYPGSLPGKEREAGLPEDQIEVGLGIHGEPGKFREPFSLAEKIIGNLMETLRTKMEMVDGEQFVVLVNNLGSVSQLEMSIVNGEVLEWFKNHNMSVKRFFSGAYMTSLDGHGISVTVLRADDAMLLYLDYPCSAPGWIPSRSTPGTANRGTSKKPRVSDVDESGATFNEKRVKSILEAVVKAMSDSEKRLNHLDAVAGDGDCGSTFAGAASAIRKALNDLNKSRPQTLFKQLSIIFEQTVGGTSGALYALMLSAAAACFSDSTGLETCVEALDRANQAVQTYGGARVGDRTMVDALNAAVEHLKSATKREGGKNFEEICENAVKASERAAEETAHQKAAVGRASYTSSEAQTLPDAGATAISIWLRAAWTAIHGSVGNE
ncbi:unnamed protein product [Caenorhabditis sp. 36 PRJEB53466]|nr:unnamed protein product [Caenorhabditis sp. 36 PRJEB53466]